MATLEDKILGEKLHNYCSSSEESDGDSSDIDECGPKLVDEDVSPQPQLNKWEGTSTNTGPKGVIKDWQRFKQLETEKRAEDERERIALMKKLTLTVQTALDEEKDKIACEDPDLAELFDDEFLLAYQKKRMEEMLQRHHHKLKFGTVQHLVNGQEYLDAIDKENKHVTVVIHIYEDRVQACKAMNACLSDLSQMYPEVKFCTIVGSRAGMSMDFKANGVPALLIYKGGQLMGNFVRLSDDLGDEFIAEDVRDYLVQHGMLEDKTCTPLLVKTGSIQIDDTDDSD